MYVPRSLPLAPIVAHVKHTAITGRCTCTTATIGNMPLYNLLLRENAVLKIARFDEAEQRSAKEIRIHSLLRSGVHEILGGGCH